MIEQFIHDFYEVVTGKSRDAQKHTSQYTVCRNFALNEE
ncbi:hypothetical protein SXCC_00516 [Gluconacetobacter sp. SXCC-1]|nr:hypothetical protein SXCC_00516 [Gluconacetobacter sp. SXCC-1]